MSVDHYRDEFARQQSHLPDDWLRARRHAALRAFADAGFPTTGQEDWKYTNLRGFLEHPFQLARALADVDTDALAARLPRDLQDAHKMVFVDGHFIDSLSSATAQPAGVTLQAWSRLTAAADGPLRAGIGACINGQANAFTDMNTAFLSDGLCLTLADNVDLHGPIHLVMVASGGQETMAHYRHLLRLGANSQATVIEHHIGLGDQAYFCNTVTEARVGPGARLTRVRLQEESAQGYHVGSLHAALERDGRMHNHGVDFGGRLIRADTNASLNGEGAEVELNGVYVADGRQHLDNHTRIDHRKPHGRSRESYKGIVSERGRGVFNGKIVVHPGARKTDSEQSSAALVLSNQAEIDAKPELEIYADDVKCAHGATVGQLDEDAVFYLMSRGIDTKNARAILTYSFANAQIARIPVPALREHIQRALLAKLGHGAAALP